MYLGEPFEGLRYQGFPAPSRLGCTCFEPGTEVVRILFENWTTPAAQLKKLDQGGSPSQDLLLEAATLFPSCARVIRPSFPHPDPNRWGGVGWGRSLET